MNEMAKELYSAAFFSPDMADQALIALDMMSFDGKNSIVSKISQNGKMGQMIQLLLPMAQELDRLSGSQYTPMVMQMLGMQMPSTTEQSIGKSQTNALETASESGNHPFVTSAKNTAANAASPR